MAKLIICDGKGNERVHELADDVTTLGRGSGNIIQVKDKEASRSHCRIEKTADGHKLVDGGSRNGTQVNEAKVRNQTLKNGDKIVIGDFVLTYDVPGALTAEDLGATIDVAPIDERTVNLPPASDGKPKYVLDVAEGKDKGKSFELGSETLTIGRLSANKYPIDDESASSYHAEISKEPTGYFITDLGSTNGTKVGGEKIVKTRLSPGAEIMIGTTKMIFKNLGAKAEEDEVFGTVVLDTERLERELAEDEAKSRVAFLIRLGVAVAVLAALGVVIYLGVIVGGGGSKTAEIPGNEIKNFSFDRGVSERGDPLDWKRMGGRYTPWQVLNDTDRVEESTSKGALVVEREDQAAPDEYAECYTPIEVATDRHYTIGGWIKTDNAQGAYGLRVRWLGQDDRKATSQVYVMGAQTQWRKIDGIVSPPAWARRAEFACFSVGNRGKVYFDDVYFIAGEAAEIRAYDVSFKGIKIEATNSGEFDVRSGVEDAIRSAGLFLVSAQDAESTQAIAEPEEPLSEKGGTTFRGTIPEFIDFANVRYVQNVRPGETGVVVEYELRSDRPLPLHRAGLRFTVTGSFGSGEMQVFDSEGKSLESRIGKLKDAQEIVFQNAEGQSLAVNCRSDEGLFHVEPIGDQRQVELVWPGQVFIGKTPTKLTVEFSPGSGFLRLKVETALKVLEDARQAKSFAAEYDALESLLAMADQFPEDAKNAGLELEGLKKKADDDLAEATALLDKLTIAPGTDARAAINTQLMTRIAALTERYADSPYDEQVAALEPKRAGIMGDIKAQEKNELAQKTLAQVLTSLRNESLPFAKAYWQKMKQEFSDTDAYRKAIEDGVPALLDGLEQLMGERDKAYARLERSVNMLLMNDLPVEALQALEGDPEYQRHKDRPRFKALYNRVKEKADAPRP